MSAATAIVLAVMATIAAIASSIAAFKANSTANSALNFQKNLSKYQDALFLLRSTSADLWRLKRILENPLAAQDDEFNSFDNLHRKIRGNMESLEETGVLARRDSKFFSADSRAEMIDEMPNSSLEIDTEIKRLQQRIDEIFA